MALIPITLTSNRRKIVQQAVKKYFTGEMSYTKANRFAKAEGLQAKLIHLFNSVYANRKSVAIDSEFDLECSKFRAINCKDALNSLDQSRYLLNNDAEMRKIFADIHFQDSKFKNIIANISYNPNAQTLAIEMNLIEKMNLKYGETATREPILGSMQFSIDHFSPEEAQLFFDHYLIYKDIYIDGKKEVAPPTKGEIITIADSSLAHRSGIQIGAEDGIINVNSKDNYQTYLNNSKSKVLEKYKESRASYFFDALCFSGGGAKGAGYSGVMKGIGDNRLFQVEKVAGTSAGSFTAALIACGMTTTEFEHFVGTRDLKLPQKQLRELMRTQLRDQVLKYFTYNDKASELIMKFIQANNSEGEIFNYRNQKYSHEEFSALKELQNKLRVDGEEINPELAKLDLTFAHLSALKKLFPEAGFKDLYITATLKNGKAGPEEVVLDFATTPNMPISLATIASAALPFVFPAVDVTDYYRPKEQHEPGKKVLLIDGGIMNNIPFAHLEDSSTNLLNIGFVADKGLHEFGVTIGEKFKELLVGMPIYHRRRFQMYKLEFFFRMYYIKDQGISIIDFKKAARQFMTMNKSIRDDFIDEEVSEQFIRKFSNATPECLDMAEKVFDLYFKQTTKADKEALKALFESLKYYENDEEFKQKFQEFVNEFTKLESRKQNQERQQYNRVLRQIQASAPFHR
jgi:predicted acylesterase/phospholipase RssA